MSLKGHYLIFYFMFTK